MVMEIARITARGQTTIPKRIRQAAGLREGDAIAFEIEDGRVTIRKIVRDEDGYLSAVAETMSEWNSAEDENAWRDL